MKFDIVTLFPEMLEPLNHSMIKRAQENEIISIDYHDPREYSTRKHKKVDDKAFGGTEGMVIQCQPMFECIENIENYQNKKIIYFSPKGNVLNQKDVEKFADSNDDFILVNGHYEGIDQRIIDHFQMEEISIGDYVLTGGEYASMIFIDSITRLIPGALNKENSHINESISSGLLEAPVYTRPANYRDLEVPEILLSGHHANIKKWNHEKSLELTKERRKDLYEAYLNKEK